MDERVVEKRTTITNQPDTGKSTNVNVGEDGTTTVQTDDVHDTTRTVRKETTVTKEVS